MIIFRERSFFRFDICVIFKIDEKNNVIEIILTFFLTFLLRRLMTIDIIINLFL